MGDVLAKSRQYDLAPSWGTCVITGGPDSKGIQVQFSSLIDIAAKTNLVPRLNVACSAASW